MNEITSPMRICGKRRCHRTAGVVDTGAEVTVITEDVARAAGLKETGRRLRGRGLSRKPVVLREAEGKVCLPGGCDCRKQKVYIAEEGTMTGSVLLGMDYLNGSSAIVDTSTGKVRCRRRRRRSG